jgi:hypothetical protein
MCVCLLVCLSVCISRKNCIYCCTTIYIYFKKKLYILLHNNIYSTYFKKKLYILLHNNIYSTYFMKKLYILLHNNIYVFQEKLYLLF